MATTVGQHSISAFATPVNGGPLDANVVRGNDNTIRTAYVDHDADPGIHVQSSTLASRPAAGTAGRKWITNDNDVYTLWFDDGSNWHPVSSENIALTVLATTALTKGDVVKVTGWNNGQDLPEVAKVASASDVAFAVMSADVSINAMGYATNTGLLLDFNTNSFNVGDILYPNTSGGFTATKPTSGHYQPCAFVLRKNANNGVLYVEFSSPRIVESSSNTASTVVLRDASGNFSAGTITAGALTSTGLVTFASLKGTGATTVTDILNDSTMATASATTLATSSSIKTYVDNKVATVDTLAEVLANGNTSGANNLIISSGQKIQTPTVAALDGTSAATIADTTGKITISAAPILSALTASQAVFTDASKGLVSNAITGTGSVVMSASPTLSGTITAANVSMSGTLTLGSDVALSRGAADRLDLATGDSLNVVSGTYKIAGTDVLTSTTLGTNVVNSSLTSVGTLANLTVTNPISGSVTGSSGSTTGNAATATALQTARNINGVSFNGTADITVTAAAGTLSGNTLASGVLASSLTSVGTLTSLTVSGAITGATSTNTINGLIVNSGALSGVTTIGLSGDMTTTANTNGIVATKIINANAGSSAIAQIVMDNDARPSNLTLRSYSNAAGSTIPDISDSVLLRSNGAGGLTISAQQAAGVIRFSTGGTTERARIDASGNLGLGVTPSAWETASSKALQFTGGSIWSFSTSQLNLLQNAIYNTSGNLVYVNTATASAYRQISGVHSWYTAASGTAGNAITFTQAMTLDASGNLTVSGDIIGSTASSAAISLNSTVGSQIRYLNYGAVTLDSGGIKFATANNTTVVERARITSGGYFKASNDGTYVNSTGSYHEIRSSTNAAGIVITNTSATYTDDLVYGSVAVAAGTGFKLMRLDSNSVEQFRVRGDGTIFAQNTTVQSLSDARLKENIVDATEGLAVISALRPVRYDWKKGYGNDRVNQLGFIAQEMEAVFPEAVSVWEMDEPTGEVDEDGKPITEKVDYKTVGPGALIPVLVKAIQELEARIAALEA